MEHGMSRIALAVLTVSLLLSNPPISRSQDLRVVKFGFASKVVTPMLANVYIGQGLGYLKQEGLTAQFIPLGPNSVVLSELASGHIDIGTGAPSFQLPLAAKDGAIGSVNFFEFSYPFKYGLAVNPNSSIHSFSDLKGKTLGVGSFGLTDFPVAKAILRLAGIDPDKDVQFLAVGEGVPGGAALQRGVVDAFFHYDTGFGLIEAAGIPLKYVPLPANVPMIGGFYLQARPDTIKNDRVMLVGFARAVAKSEIFIRENPKAAAYEFLKMFPDAAPKAVSLDEQLKAVMVPMVRRSKLFSSYDKSVTMLGQMKKEEWEEEIKFIGLQDKIKEPSAFFTNDLIADINNFDVDAIRTQAKTFAMPEGGSDAREN
ncbi:MAG TPA: ABC transporter substrate-binding protein [Xanthobacteraceae bacterium]|jgi:NitT/TauT family transport system substrate-binding protein|nr:ABC transporter substrate-binding protein [Xanthobacteraceae bacterium]